MSAAGKLCLKLPATSANLGPGFDTAALALAMHLEIEAQPAETFSIAATGFHADLCSRIEGNLLVATYRQFAPSAPALAITMRNGIPLGMGCGSSAATRLAAVTLANHYGELGWERARILREVVRLEGHPDNAAACWLGGFVVASDCGGEILAHRVRPPAWHALVAMPLAPLATTASRRVLPESYSRADVVYNLQRIALLTAAFTSARAELLPCATGDRIHQPYRSEVCPLLPRLMPLAGDDGILSVTLSGAGPAVLLLLDSADRAAAAEEQVRRAAGEVALAGVLSCALEADPVSCTWCSL